jgi:hypothetical protein
LVGTPKKKGYIEFPQVDRRIILKWILRRKWVWVGLIRFYIGTGSGVF